MGYWNNIKIMKKSVPCFEIISIVYGRPPIPPPIRLVYSRYTLVNLVPFLLQLIHWHDYTKNIEFKPSKVHSALCGHSMVMYLWSIPTILKCEFRWHFCGLITQYWHYSHNYSSKWFCVIKISMDFTYKQYGCISLLAVHTDESCTGEGIKGPY